MLYIALSRPITELEKSKKKALSFTPLIVQKTWSMKKPPKEVNSTVTLFFVVGVEKNQN